MNDLNAAGRHGAAKLLKGTRWAILKNPANQTGAQRTTVESIRTTSRKTNRKLYMAYLLKEQLRELFKVGGDKGKKLLAGRLTWVARCRIPEFVKTGETVRKQLTAIHNPASLLDRRSVTH